MKNRNLSIDIFKGLLIIGMVISHVICIFSNRNDFIIPKHISIFVDCITFSGFLFCFGYANKMAYLSKEIKNVWMKLLLNSGKTYLAYLFSGLFYKFFIEKTDLSILQFVKVALFIDVPILSEFLISFSLFSLFTLIAFKLFKKILSDKRLFWITFTILLLTTFIPFVNTRTNQVGLIIGSNKFGSFPLLQYMPIYLLGMYFAEYKIVFNIKLFIGSVICTMIPLSYYIYSHNLPARFQPSLLWIISPFLFIYCYYLLSQFIKSSLLQFIGQNTLFYLLMSNIIIFSIRGATKYALFPDPFAVKAFLTAIVTIGFITYTGKLLTRQKLNEELPSRVNEK